MNIRLSSKLGGQSLSVSVQSISNLIEVHIEEQTRDRYLDWDVLPESVKIGEQIRGMEARMHH